MFKILMNIYSQQRTIICYIFFNILTQLSLTYDFIFHFYDIFILQQIKIFLYLCKKNNNTQKIYQLHHYNQQIANKTQLYQNNQQIYQHHRNLHLKYNINTALQQQHLTYIQQDSTIQNTKQKIQNMLVKQQKHQQENSHQQNNQPNHQSSCSTSADHPYNTNLCYDLSANINMLQQRFSRKQQFSLREISSLLYVLMINVRQICKSKQEDERIGYEQKKQKKEMENTKQQAIQVSVKEELADGEENRQKQTQKQKINDKNQSSEQKKIQINHDKYLTKQQFQFLQANLNLLLQNHFKKIQEIDKKIKELQLLLSKNPIISQKSVIKDNKELASHNADAKTLSTLSTQQKSKQNNQKYQNANLNTSLSAFLNYFTRRPLTIDHQCRYYRQLKVVSNQLQSKMPTSYAAYIFCEQKVSSFCSFSLKITKKSSKYAFAIGIINTELKKKSDLQDMKNRIYYYSNGILEANGNQSSLAEDRGKKYGQGDVVVVTINLDEGHIEWRVKGQILYQYKGSQMMKDRKIIWVPFVMMSNQGDTVQLGDIVSY